MTYTVFDVRVAEHIAHVRLNRPDKSNALNDVAWKELEAIFQDIDTNPAVRVAILSGEGKHFCAGIDLSLLMSIRQAAENDCDGRMREQVRTFVKKLQAPVNAIENCRKPVLAAIHGACLGAGVDITTACDMRYATEDAFFAIEEINMGMVADLGTLQRLPKLIGDGITRELAYTGRRMSGKEAQAVGLINRCFADVTQMMNEVQGLAEMIAQKSPLSIRGTKQTLNYSRDHSVVEGLEFIATWNAGMLLSNDLTEAFMAYTEKRAPQFAD